MSAYEALEQLWHEIHDTDRLPRANGIPCPVTLSDECRILVDKVLSGALFPKPGDLVHDPLGSLWHVDTINDSQAKLTRDDGCVMLAPLGCLRGWEVVA